MTGLTRVVTTITNAFPLWVLAGSALALARPSLFTWFGGPLIPIRTRSPRLAGQERVTEDFVGAGFVLALRTPEGVDRRTDAHLDEARLFEELLPACTRQATGNSAGP